MQLIKNGDIILDGTKTRNEKTKEADDYNECIKTSLRLKKLTQEEYDLLKEELL